jgi:hypothetical protein
MKTRVAAKTTKTKKSVAGSLTAHDEPKCAVNGCTRRRRVIVGPDHHDMLCSQCTMRLGPLDVRRLKLPARGAPTQERYFVLLLTGEFADAVRLLASDIAFERAEAARARRKVL